MPYDDNFQVKKQRPEDIYRDVRNYYKNDTLLKYANSKNLMRIQEKITKRVIDILNFKNSQKLILDAGCGPGFASFYLQQHGFRLVSLDLINEFLKVYDMSGLNPINGDMCNCSFRPNSFDGIVSISALQWIYQDFDKEKTNKIMIGLVKSFYSMLKEHGKIVIQFYPKNSEVMKKVGTYFIDNASFEGGYIIDNLKSPKKRKIYLKLKKF